MKINWNYPTTIWVGENRIQDLGLACKNLKIHKPLFVTDKDLINLKMVQDIIKDLKKTHNHLQVFSNFSGNPVGENVDCLLYTSDAADDDHCVDLGGRRIIKKKF